jgi:hypothetical protein
MQFVYLLSRFANPQVLLDHANDFINRRMDSLKNDESHRVKTEPNAPYSALIYCFSNIDLLGALYVGKVGKKMHLLTNTVKISNILLVILKNKALFNVYTEVNSFI